MTALGFVVLARRPNPNGGHTLEPVSAVFNGPKALEQAQNVVESLTARHKRSEYDDDPFVSDSYLRYNELVEYVIGEIRAVHRCGHCGRDSGQPDGTCIERMVVDGQVVGERELDAVPDDWPEL